MKRLILGMVVAIFTFLLAGCAGEKDTISGKYFRPTPSGLNFVVAIEKMPDSDNLYEYKRFSANQNQDNKYWQDEKKVMQYDKKNNILAEYNIPSAFRIIIKGEDSIVLYNSQTELEYKRLSPEEAAKLQLPEKK